MDIGAYRTAVQNYVKLALDNTDGSNKQISEYLWSVSVPRFLARNKTEKRRALADVRKAFDDHAHWPLEVILSQLGVDKELLNLKS
jgi:hypothetical protein